MTVYPRARLEWASESAACFQLDHHFLAFMLDSHAIRFNDADEPEFYCDPFESSFKPTHNYNFLTADGETLTAGGEKLEW